MAYTATIGKVSIFGADGSVVATGLGTIEVNGVELNDSFDIAKLKGGKNNVIGETASNRAFEFTVHFTPVADASPSMGLPKPLAEVVLSGFGAPFDGKTVYDRPGSISRSQDGYVKMSLGVTRYTDMDGAAVLPT